MNNKSCNVRAVMENIDWWALTSEYWLLPLKPTITNRFCLNKITVPVIACKRASWKAVNVAMVWLFFFYFLCKAERFGHQAIKKVFTLSTQAKQLILLTCTCAFDFCLPCTITRQHRIDVYEIIYYDVISGVDKNKLGQFTALYWK